MLVLFWIYVCLCIYIIFYACILYSGYNPAAQFNIWRILRATVGKSMRRAHCFDVGDRWDFTNHRVNPLRMEPQLEATASCQNCKCKTETSDTKRIENIYVYTWIRIYVLIDVWKLYPVHLYFIFLVYYMNYCSLCMLISSWLTRANLTEHSMVWIMHNCIH